MTEGRSETEKATGDQPYRLDCAYAEVSGSHGPIKELFDTPLEPFGSQSGSHLSRDSGSMIGRLRMAKEPGKFAGATWVGITTPISVVFRQEHRSITTIPLRDNPHLSAVTGLVGRE